MVDSDLKHTDGETSSTDDHTGPLARLMIATLKALGRLPFQTRSRLGYLLGSLAGIFPTRERDIARYQTSLFLGDRSSTTARRAFGSAGSYILESLNLAPMLDTTLQHIECANWTSVEPLLGSGRPIVALTAHTGNWDLLAAYCIARGAKVSTIGREARSKTIQAALRWIRDGYGIETIWRSDRSGLKRIISCFREGRVVAALIDQDTRVDSEYVPFFGRPARTPSSLVTMGKKFNAYFVTAFIVRTAPGEFRIYLEPLAEELSPHEILRVYSERLEAVIRAHPDQWVWFHKRWRSRPEGGTMSSSEYLTWLENTVKVERAE